MNWSGLEEKGNLNDTPKEHPWPSPQARPLPTYQQQVEHKEKSTRGSGSWAQEVGRAHSHDVKMQSHYSQAEHILTNTALDIGQS